MGTDEPHPVTLLSKACFPLELWASPAPALSQCWETPVLPGRRLRDKMEQGAVRRRQKGTGCQEILNLSPDTF